MLLSPSAALVIAIIFIVDQHVQAQPGEGRAPWPPNGIKKAIVDARSTPHASVVTEAAKKLK
jgi:hypothetical protein